MSIGESKMFGFGDQTKKAGEGVALIGDALDKLFTSDEEKLSKQEAIIRLQSKGTEIVGNAMLNDSVSRNWWQSGWRPFIGWIAGIGLAIYFIPQYIVAAYIFVDSFRSTGSVIDFPASPDALMELVIALLGLGTLRTVEKVLDKAK